MAGPDLPAKLYFRIGEVASLVGVEPHVLRYWEREFKSIRPQKSAKGQRVYSRRDVETLLKVRELLYREGFTIAGARKRLQKAGVEPETPEPNSQRLKETLIELRNQVAAFLEELGG
jgi:DNA-binding transcriptional MerR regulator